jgi:hypothetical protein
MSLRQRFNGKTLGCFGMSLGLLRDRPVADAIGDIIRLASLAQIGKQGDIQIDICGFSLPIVDANDATHEQVLDENLVHFSPIY